MIDASGFDREAVDRESADRLAKAAHGAAPHVDDCLGCQRLAAEMLGNDPQLAIDIHVGRSLRGLTDDAPA